MRSLVAVIAALFLVASCATQASYGGTVKSDAVRDISGSPVFIYSFLDLWTPQIGTQLVEATDRQLTRRFAQHNVRTSIIHLYNSGRLAAVRSRSNGVVTLEEHVTVPIEEIVADHRDEEQALGAVYRLIIMPPDGARARWSLIDVETSEVVWSTHMSFSLGEFRGETTEEADQEYAPIVDGAFEEMYASGLLPRPS